MYESPQLFLFIIKFCMKITSNGYKNFDSDHVETKK